MPNKNKDVDNYIKAYPVKVRQRLSALRKAIRSAAPAAEERISYMMPGYYLNGPLVYFGGFADHVGFFPTSLGVKSFKKELASYKTSKGTVRFPHDKPIPLALVKKIVKLRLKQNTAKKK